MANGMLNISADTPYMFCRTNGELEIYANMPLPIKAWLKAKPINARSPSKCRNVISFQAVIQAMRSEP
ncbi:hypothetical protein MTN95_10830 [Bacillus sp. 2CMS4F]|uniref:hypothetical protein n=1 Tax=Bacillus sp. 2CMS4F TaxID=2929170 RepID=UPI0020BE4E5B|nr:hypothetical protein [Bacillus sp. 2CMS4F]